MKRVITAVCLAIFALYSIFLAPFWLFLAIAAMMACFCYYEYIGIAQATGVHGVLWIGYILGLITFARPDVVPLIVLTLLVLSLGLHDLRGALTFAAAVLLGIAYIFLAWRWAAGLRQIHPAWLFYALSINWVGDAAAYYTGRTFGRHKLAPSVSPGKSWEGAAGSLIATTGYGVVFASQMKLGPGATEIALLSVLANIAGQLGDLAESALKRGAGLKDSGALLPGHGGFLDRLDSSLFTLPVVYHYLIWTHRAAGGLFI